jgi:FkbM family methyltransferase
MTSLMAAKVGTGGKVFAFEPHPEIFEELKHNAFIGHCGASVSVENP